MDRASEAMPWSVRPTAVATPGPSRRVVDVVLALGARAVVVLLVAAGPGKGVLNRNARPQRGAAVQRSESWTFQ
jgi:hypothetical protein